MLTYLGMYVKILGGLYLLKKQKIYTYLYYQLQFFYTFAYSIIFLT